jgi:hypothetical protein
LRLRLQEHPARSPRPADVYRGANARHREGGWWPRRSPLRRMRDSSLPEHRDPGVRRRAVAPPRCWTVLVETWSSPSKLTFLTPRNHNSSWAYQHRGFPELCRFSDAGNADLTARCDGRRPKSAKARNRVGRWCCGGAASSRRCRRHYGDLEPRLSRIMPRRDEGCDWFALG